MELRDIQKLKDNTKDIINKDLNDIKKEIDVLMYDELSLLDLSYHDSELDELLKDLRQQLNDYIYYRYKSAMEESEF